MAHNHRPAARYTGDETQARAGEAGEGFAVVADEVKSLAEESQDHASDIERMVDELVEQAEQMADGAESVAAANEQQSAKVREINDTVQRLTEE